MKEMKFLPLTSSPHPVKQADNDSGAGLPNGSLSPSVTTKSIQVHIRINLKERIIKKSKFIHLALSGMFFLLSVSPSR